MNTAKCYAVMLAVTLLVTGCSKDKQPMMYPVDEDVILIDVQYGDHEQQRMDVYLPAARTRDKTKIIVFIHGGGWTAGDKDDLPLTEESLQALRENFPGHALINLNYRLVSGTENQYPIAENDVKRAMDYVYQQLEAYQLSEATYMAGGSAGAHLAALHTLKHNNDGRIQGCIAIAGVYNMVTLYNQGNDEAKQFVAAFMGGTPTDQSSRYEQASPVNFVTPSSAKFLLLHGTEDALVPVSQVNEMRDALANSNVSHTVFTYPGGHGIPPEHLASAFDYIAAFLQ